MQILHNRFFARSVLLGFLIITIIAEIWLILEPSVFFSLSNPELCIEENFYLSNVSRTWHSLLDRLCKVIPARGEEVDEWPPATAYDKEEKAWYITLEELEPPLPGWRGTIIWKEQANGESGDASLRAVFKAPDFNFRKIRILFYGVGPWNSSDIQEEIEVWLRETESERRLLIRRSDYVLSSTFRRESVFSEDLKACSGKVTSGLATFSFNLSKFCMLTPSNFVPER